MTPQDFLCDFCGQCWDNDRPMVEGHRGALICAPCLAAAYAELWVALGGEHLPQGDVCTMCLARTGDPVWRSPARRDALICKRCAKQSAVMLERDPESNWKRPAPP